MVLFVFLSTLTSVFIGIIYYQDFLTAQNNPQSFSLLFDNFIKVYSALLIFIGLCTWWLILIHESRLLAHEETTKQTQLLLKEIEEHKITDQKYQQAIITADNANSAKSRFLSNMSHEIRTPLNCIVGYSHILHNDPSIPGHRREAIEILKRSSEHLSSLIEDILDIAGIEERKFELRYAPLELPLLIEHLVSSFKAQAEDKGLIFHCHIVDTLPQIVRGDEKRIRQVLINLLSNAIKFTNEGEIIFRVGYRSDVATFQIIDSGEGISEENLEDIFQPFTRLSKATGNAVAGSGLGLTLCKIITELMGGEITVKSLENQGSTFTVRFLLTSLSNTAKIVVEKNIVGFQENSKNILIVDDQYEHRTLIENILEPLGFCVEQADSGEACLAMLPGFMPDLILMDLSMNGISGIETSQRLRQKGYAMPIVVVSANAYLSDQQAALEVGCDDFLAKPLQVAELLNSLALHLSLNWIYDAHKKEKTISEQNNVFTMPPPNIIKQLMEFVQIGDLLGLKLQLNDLIMSEPSYKGFTQRVKTLASEFRIREIKKLLNTVNDGSINK